jgi:hypothetical protein
MLHLFSEIHQFLYRDIATLWVNSCELVTLTFSSLLTDSEFFCLPNLSNKASLALMARLSDVTISPSKNERMF